METSALPAKSIVVFDDDEDILFICKRLLNLLGWQVTTFTDCDNVVEKVATINPDVVLMDNWLPIEGGIVSTRLLKANDHLKDIPVIFFTANSNIEQLAKEAGADYWLAKPFDLQELEKTVNIARKIS